MNRLKYLPEKTEPSLIRALLSLKSLLTWLGIGLLRLTSYLPYSILMNLGDGIGNLIYKVSPHRREICEINIKLCLDIKDNELDKLVKENFRAIGRGMSREKMMRTCEGSALLAVGDGPQVKNVDPEEHHAQGCLPLLF